MLAERWDWSACMDSIHPENHVKLESYACLVMFHTDFSNMLAYALSPLQGGRSHLVHTSLM